MIDYFLAAAHRFEMFNPCLVNTTFRQPLNTSQKQKFSDVLMGCRNGSFALNRFWTIVGNNMQIHITDQKIAGNSLIFSIFTNSVFKISQGNHICQLDICLFKVDNNDFSDTNKKFLSSINQIHSTAADFGNYLLSLKSSKV